MTNKKKVKKKVTRKAKSKPKLRKVVKAKPKEVKKEKKLGLFIFIFPPILLILTFVFFLTFLFVKNYQSWEKTFPEPDILILDFPNDSTSLDEKIKKYNEDQSEYSFIELTKEESLLLMSNSFEQSLPDWVELEKTGLHTTQGTWSLYLKTKAFSFEMPWLEIILVKENLQSVEILVKDVSVGDLSLRNINLGFVIEEINDGFGRAMRLVNDGNFAGRIFENIELGDQNLVIKSRSFSY